MTINYGKRAAGALTASSPGDTLYIPFATYNDSGASIGIGGTLAVSDIEIFKNGDVTPRATDSGYSVLTDTGQYGDRLGLHRIKIQIYNTADDTGFFDAGSQYHVAIDAITVDARPVRFFPAVFEVGTPLADVVKIDGDTGGADRLGKLAALQLKTDGTFDTGTGQVTNTFNVNAAALSDTGINNRLAVIAADTDTGIQSSVTVTLLLDTGPVSNAVWNSLRASHVAAGSFGQYVIADVDLMDGDTGAADVLQKFADTTGALSPSGELDTGSGSPIADTGWVSRAVWDSRRADHTSSATFGNYIFADMQYVDGDTGAANVLSKFAGTAGALNPDGDLDTGSVANSSYLPANVIRWLGTAAATPTVAGVPKTEVVSFADTGINNRLAVIAADTDTGIQSSVNVTSFADTGVNDRLAKILADTDTGIQSGVNVTSFADTGVNDRLAKILADTDTGIQSGVTITAFSDTGVNGRLTAIQTKTDSLTFTVAGVVDANIQRVNDINVTGTGASGDEWGP